MIDRKGFRVSFPIECGRLANDDLLLSTASGRDSGYIAVHRYHRDDPADSAAYFASFRPSWWATAPSRPLGQAARATRPTSGAYPGFESFLPSATGYDRIGCLPAPVSKKVLG